MAYHLILMVHREIGNPDKNISLEAKPHNRFMINRNLYKIPKFTHKSQGLFHPEWPIIYTEQDEPGIGEEPWTNEEYAAYDQQFVAAYQQKKILLNRSAMLSPFAAAYPSYDISMEDEMAYVDWSEALLTQEAFKLADKITFHFFSNVNPINLSV